MGTADSGTEQGGRRFPDIGADLLGGGTTSPTVGVRDMGNDTAYTEGAQQIPP